MKAKPILIQVNQEMLSDLADKSYVDWCKTMSYPETDNLYSEDLSGPFCDGYERGFYAALSQWAKRGK